MPQRRALSFGGDSANDYGAPHPQPNSRSFAWRDYGNRVGAWRLLELAEAYDLPYALLINTELYDYCPQMVAAFSKRGDEIVGHGRTNAERQCRHDALKKRAPASRKPRPAIEKHEGRRPMGWLAPYISQTRDSPDLLREGGLSLHDGLAARRPPVWFRTKHGPILSIPYAQTSTTRSRA